MWENNVFRYFVSSYDIQRKKFPPLNFTTLNFIPKEERFLEYAKVFVRNRDIKVEYIGMLISRYQTVVFVVYVMIVIAFYLLIRNIKICNIFVRISKLGFL